MKISSLDELKAFAGDFIKKYPVGGVFALEGDLGAGKTTFVRLLIELISKEENKKTPRVTSPTYVYHQNYELKKNVEHFDLYRLENATESDLMSIGYPDALARIKNGGGFLFIEWPEKVKNRNLLHLDGTLKFSILSDTEREISILPSVRE